MINEAISALVTGSSGQYRRSGCPSPIPGDTDFGGGPGSTPRGQTALGRGGTADYSEYRTQTGVETLPRD